VGGGGDGVSNKNPVHGEGQSSTTKNDASGTPWCCGGRTLVEKEQRRRKKRAGRGKGEKENRKGKRYVVSDRPSTTKERFTEERKKNGSRAGGGGKTGGKISFRSGGVRKS